MAPMIPMVSMELDDEDKLDAVHPIPIAAKPDYPYGLKGCLTNPELEKLGLDPTDARVDGTFLMQAICKVTNVSVDENGNGKCYRVEFQICDMGILGSDEEADEAA